MTSADEQEIRRRLARLERQIDTLTRFTLAQGIRTMEELAQLEAAIERNDTVDGSIIVLVDGLVTQVTQLAAQLADGAATAAEVAAFKAKAADLAARLTAANDRIAEKVIANTPSAEVEP